MRRLTTSNKMSSPDSADGGSMRVTTASRSLPDISTPKTHGVRGSFRASLGHLCNRARCQRHQRNSESSSSSQPKIDYELNQNNFHNHHHLVDLNQIANNSRRPQSSDSSSRRQVGLGRKPVINDKASQISLATASSSESSKNNADSSEKQLGKLSLRKLSRPQLNSLILVCMSSFFCSVTFSCIAPFFPMEALAKDATETEIGGIFGVYELAVLLSSPLWARLVPTMGARTMFVMGAFMVGSCSILYGTLEWAPSGATFVALCFLIRFFEGFGAACYLTAEVPILANQFPDNIAAVIGLQAMSISSGFMLGPLVGSVLYTLGGFCTPFFVLGATGLTTSVVGFFVLPEIIYENDVDPTKEDQHVAGFRQLLKIPTVLVVCVCAAATCAGYAFFDSMLSPFLTNTFQLSAILIGIWFLITGICEAGTSPLVGYALDRRPLHLQCMLLGALIAAVGFLLIGPSPLLAAFLPTIIPISIAAQAVVGLSVSLLLVPTSSILNSCEKAGFVPSAALHGTVGGLVTFSESAGNLLGPTLGGYLTETLSFEWTATIVAGMFLGLAILLLVTTMSEKIFGWHGRLMTGRTRELV